MSIYVCDSALKAEQAKQFLINQGYPEAGIKADQSEHVIYDGEKYGGGTSDDQVNCWVVIGRK